MAPPAPAARTNRPGRRGSHGDALHTVWLRADAPPLPAQGAPCNGCGVCCALEPCPLGALASRRRHGRCRLLRWHADSGAYRCGALTRTTALPWPWVRRLAHAAVARWIGAGVGCDAALQREASPLG